MSDQYKVELLSASWHKSTRSSGSKDCVEVAFLRNSLIGIRDSKDAAGPALVFGPWRTGCLHRWCRALRVSAGRTLGEVAIRVGLLVIGQSRRIAGVHPSETATACVVTTCPSRAEHPARERRRFTPMSKAVARHYRVCPDLDRL